MLNPFRTATMAFLVLVTSFGVGWAGSMDEEKALSAGSIEMWSTGDLDLVDQTFTKDYINHQQPDVDGGVESLTLDEWTKALKGYRQSFPETTVEILMQVGEGDTVATHWRFTGTQTGTYLGLEPTGKTVTWTGTQIDRFEDGKIAESWVNWDMYTMFKQLGLLK
ncbi:MAG: ester cyclase [Pseudomonadota bacterium]